MEELILIKKWIHKHGVIEVSQNIRWSIRQLFAIAPLISSCLLLITILEGAGPVLTILVIQHLIDVTLASAGKGEGFIDIVPWLVCFFIVQMLTRDIAMKLGKPFLTRLNQKIEYELGRKRLEKASKIPLSYFENSTTYDRIHRSSHPGNKLSEFYDQLLVLISNLFHLISVALIFSVISPWLPILLIALIIPKSFVSLKALKIWIQLTYGQTEEQRKAAYLNGVVTGRHEQKELRIFGLNRPIIRMWKHYRNKLKTEQLRQRKKIRWIEVPVDVLDLIVYLALALLLAMLLIQKKITPGTFFALFQSVSSLSNINIGFIFSNMLRTATEVRFVREFMEMDTPEEQQGILPFPSSLTEGFILDQVSFHYPGSDRLILNGLSLQLQPGERVALVGENGAGKSTIVRLLLGLYEPVSGAVRVDNINYTDMDHSQLRSKVTAVFQDFHNFELTLGQSIGIGDTAFFGGPEELTADRNQVLRAAELGGALDLVNDLSAGLDTPIGHQFDGAVGLSGGQWQRVAMGRALMREPELLILDEPTAALDPKAEYEIYKRFNEIIRGKTVLSISHRLGLARLADRILVLKNGAIVEEGCHDELIERGGEYFHMWEEQAQWYR